MSDVLKPNPGLLCKLGSALVHCDEMLSSDGHSFDRIALEQLMRDPEVDEWIRRMGALAFVPVKRKP